MLRSAVAVSARALCRSAAVSASTISDRSRVAGRQNPLDHTWRTVSKNG